MNYKNYFDKYTYVLTNSGWKFIRDIDLDNDLVAQFESNFSISFTKPYNYNCFFYDGPLVTITSNSGLSVLTITPDSEVPYLQDIKGTCKHHVDSIHNIDLTKNNYLYTAGTRTEGSLPELYLDKKYTKDELDSIQTEAVLKGFSIIINDSEDNAYYLNTNTAPFEDNDITTHSYREMIYSLSVPSGMIITRRLNKVVVGCTNV